MLGSSSVPSLLPTPRPALSAPMAWFGGQLATDLLETVDLSVNPAALQSAGWWAVSATFEGTVTGDRFGRVEYAPSLAERLGADPNGWSGPDPGEWVSSMNREQYLAGVQTIRDRIAAGDVYQ